MAAWRSANVLVALLVVAAAWIHPGVFTVEGNNAASSPFPAIILLGDSTIDVGTNNDLITVIKSDFPPYGRDLTMQLPKGRFCNGLLVTDYLAQDLGFPYQIPYLQRAGQEQKLLTGVNFASSGSGWVNLTADTYVDQFKDYKKELISMVGQTQADNIISNALYVISTGTNDYVLSYYVNPLVQKKYSIPAYQQLIRDTATVYLQDLYNEGARNFALASLPPLGCLPAVISIYGNKGLGPEGCVAPLNEVARAGNDVFRHVFMPKLERQLVGSKLVYLDVYTVLFELAANPRAFGYKEARKSCCGTGLVEVAILCNPASFGTCDDSNEYVFFDSFHPTTRTYKLVYDEFVWPVVKAAFNF
ncbi:hypothetical protein AXG93_1130s1270 [Marchantia polymorpha subsp. ruderalis]|uniref:Uncharacterized protein n=1 Tax=Marchantia polymorpha subsp. ruderalis TaxID=1480154 RepID=A0A176VG47_MARPO|nr:hypothetical protein AXG93_1130s1270 [Marchantia polymorpha subsp. ruderalis]